MLAYPDPAAWLPWIGMQVLSLGFLSEVDLALLPYRLAVVRSFEFVSLGYLVFRMGSAALRSPGLEEAVRVGAVAKGLAYSRRSLNASCGVMRVYWQHCLHHRGQGKKRVPSGTFLQTNGYSGDFFCCCCFVFFLLR